MTARLKYGFLCDGAMLVAGKWTYQGLFDRIHTFKFPTVHPEAVLAAKFSGPVGSHKLRVQLTDSTGRLVLPELSQPIECPEFVDNTIALRLQNLSFSSPGFYSFHLFLDADATPFGSVEFQVIKEG
jgi:hypothetical protein